MEGQCEERSCTLEAGCTTGSRQPSRVRARTTQSCFWLQEGDWMHPGEYICIQGNVCFCLLWVLLFSLWGKQWYLFTQYFYCSVRLHWLQIHAPLLATDIFISSLCVFFFIPCGVLWMSPFSHSLSSSVLTTVLPLPILFFSYIIRNEKNVIVDYWGARYAPDRLLEKENSLFFKDLLKTGSLT